MEYKELLKSIEILSTHSELAKRILKYGKFNITTIFDEGNVLVDHNTSKNNNYHYDGEIGFHPTGASGVVLMDDEYIFGIRCNHLQWVEGDVEYDIENDNLTWNETLNNNGEIIGKQETEKNNSCVGNAIMLIGNHKGHLQIKLITVPYK